MKTVKRKMKSAPIKPENKMVPIEMIQPHESNYNYHPTSQIEQLEKSLEDLGQYRSLVLWQQIDGTYIQLAGHGVKEAMEAHGLTEVRADVFPPELDPIIAKQILIADNLHAKNSEPDLDLLTTLLVEQRDLGLDLGIVGTDANALEEMLKSIAGDDYTDNNPLPEKGDAPVSEISDQWALLISCEDEDQQLELLERFQAEGLSCRVLIS